MTWINHRRLLAAGYNHIGSLQYPGRDWPIISKVYQKASTDSIILISTEDRTTTTTEINFKEFIKKCDIMGGVFGFNPKIFIPRKSKTFKIDMSDNIKVFCKAMKRTLKDNLQISAIIDPIGKAITLKEDADLFYFNIFFSDFIYPMPSKRS